MTWSELLQYREGPTEYSVTYKDGDMAGIRSFGRDRRKAEECFSDYAIRGCEASMTGIVPLINGQGVTTDHVVQSVVMAEQWREMMRQSLQHGLPASRIGTLSPANYANRVQEEKVDPEELAAAVKRIEEAPGEVVVMNAEE